MKPKLILGWLATCCALLAACIRDTPKSTPAPPPPAAAAAAPDGLTVVETTPGPSFNPGGDARLFAVRADLAKLRLRVVPSRGARASWPSAQQVAEAQPGALAALNGGYFDAQEHALGLVIADGVRVRPLRKVDWGVFLLRGGRASIVHTRAVGSLAGVSQALQCGPRLVVDGEPTQLKPSVSTPRSAVGIDASGRVVLVAMLPGLPLSVFARLLAAPEAQGGLGLVSALNLDGGPSTQLWALGATRVAGGYGMPNFLVLSERAPR